jgi:REP element-mobilizing transposase RayT
VVGDYYGVCGNIAMLTPFTSRPTLMTCEYFEIQMRHFWARGYFCETAGELTKQMIDEYLAHHFERDPNDGFEVEP